MKFWQVISGWVICNPGYMSFASVPFLCSNVDLVATTLKTLQPLLWLECNCNKKPQCSHSQHVTIISNRCSKLTVHYYDTHCTLSLSLSLSLSYLSLNIIFYNIRYPTWHEKEMKKKRESEEFLFCDEIDTYRDGKQMILKIATSCPCATLSKLSICE